MLAMVVNDDAGCLMPRGVAPTGLQRSLANLLLKPCSRPFSLPLESCGIKQRFKKTIYTLSNR